MAWNGVGMKHRESSGELRFVLEIEPMGPDPELDGDKGKEGSRTTLGICPTDTLKLVRTAVGSRLFIHQTLLAMGKLGNRGSGRLAKWLWYSYTMERYGTITK